MEPKIMIYKEGKARISSKHNIDYLSEFLDGTYSNPLEFVFAPDIIMTESQCLNFLSTIRAEIIENIEEVINLNSDFYDNFEIEYLDFFKKEDLYHEITNKKVCGNCSMFIQVKPKKELIDE